MKCWPELSSCALSHLYNKVLCCSKDIELAGFCSTLAVLYNALIFFFRAREMVAARTAFSLKMFRDVACSLILDNIAFWGEDMKEDIKIIAPGLC